MNELRLISFLPAATEMVFALGLGDRLVGVSHECDFPAPAKTKPVVVKPALPLEKLSLREIPLLPSASAADRICTKWTSGCFVDGNCRVVAGDINRVALRLRLGSGGSASEATVAATWLEWFARSRK
jgi:hypothetical protein